MPRLSSLPLELRYLQPFRKQVAKLKPEEIDESMNLSQLNKLLLNRIEGISVEAGKKRLEEDYTVLEQWLALPELNDNGGMIFLQSYLMALPELVDRLLEEQTKSRELDVIEMKLPPEAKVKKHLGGGGGWQVNWLRAKLFLIPTIKKIFQLKIDEFSKNLSLGHPVYKFTVTPVAFGDVKGTKCLVDASMVEGMTAEYVLEVPGGFVTGSLITSGNRIDKTKFKELEDKFEKYFHTIRVIREKK